MRSTMEDLLVIKYKLPYFCINSSKAPNTQNTDDKIILEMGFKDKIG